MKNTNSYSACDNCSWKGRPKIGLEAIPRLSERLDEGGEVPSGECPKCGALCYKIKKSKQPKQSNKFCLCGHSAVEHHFGECYSPNLSKEGVINGVCSCAKYTEMCGKPAKKKAAPKYDAHCHKPPAYKPLESLLAAPRPKSSKRLNPPTFGSY